MVAQQCRRCSHLAKAEVQDIERVGGRNGKGIRFKLFCLSGVTNEYPLARGRSESNYLFKTVKGAAFNNFSIVTFL